MGILSTNPQEMMPQEESPQQGGQKMDDQTAFDKFVINAMNILHTSKTAEVIIDWIKKSSDTVQAVGDAALDVVKRLEASAEQNKVPITANTIVNGLNVIVGEIVNICEAAGANPLDEEQKYQAYSWAISKYLDDSVKSGKITKDDLVRVTQMIEQQGGGHGEEIPGGESPSERQMPQGQQMQGGL